MTAGKCHVRKGEPAVSAGLIAEPDTWVVTSDGQSYAFLLAECTLVVVEVRMALDDCQRGEKWIGLVEALLLTNNGQICPQASLNPHGSIQPPVGGVSRVSVTLSPPIPKGATSGNFPGSEIISALSGCRGQAIGKPKPI